MCRNELYSWILRSFTSLSKEESDERFQDCDENEDGKVTWDEYQVSVQSSTYAYHTSPPALRTYTVVPQYRHTLPLSLGPLPIPL